ncbi:MAG: site-2 protease family protein [Chloroflexi bacterium]|nr:site-2 protease family protein [Chloroflexota bacterium]
MPVIGNTGLAILAFFVVLGPLILFHELGHFLAARFNKITVEEFGIGFPPRMVTLFEQGGTKFTLNWIPLGGFMRPAGEDDPNIPGGFATAPPWVRISVLAAGPLANVLFAFLLLIGMYMLGAPDPQPGAQITLVAEDSPAEQAGLLVGDIVLQADEVEIESTNDLITHVGTHGGEEVLLTVQRDQTTVQLPITPRTEWPEGQGPTGIQISSVFETRRFGPFEAVGRAATDSVDMILVLPRAISAVIEGVIPARLLRPVSVVGISQLGGQYIDVSVQQNALWPIVQLTAYISIAIGITNLLPFPALDGGRIAFAVLELIRGRRIDPEREMVVHFIGFAVLLAAMFIFIYLDIVDPVVQ